MLDIYSKVGYIVGAERQRRNTNMEFNGVNHIYQVIKHTDGVSKVVFETENEEEAYHYAEVANHFNSEFTYSYFDVDC